MANKLDFKAKMPSDAELRRMFDAVPQLERYRVGDKVMRAGARPIVKRARQLAPRSTKADRDKRSKKQQAAADWTYPLWKTIKYVIRRPRKGTGLAVIGPEWPRGNKAYFNTSPSGRKQVLWGKRTGKTIPAIRNWIVQAFDETRPQALTAMKTELQKLMREIWE